MKKVILNRNICDIGLAVHGPFAESVHQLLKWKSNNLCVLSLPTLLGKEVHLDVHISKVSESLP